MKIHLVTIAMNDSLCDDSVYSIADLMHTQDVMVTCITHIPILDVLDVLKTIANIDVVFLTIHQSCIVKHVHNMVIAVRHAFHAVPAILLCNHQTLLCNKSLLTRTEADAVYWGRDETTLLHLLSTFGFRARRIQKRNHHR
jgi:hypothetical protein